MATREKGTGQVGRGSHDSYLEKVQSGGLAKARNAAITKSRRVLPRGVHKHPKVRKEQQSQGG